MLHNNTVHSTMSEQSASLEKEWDQVGACIGALDLFLVKDILKS